MCAVSFEIRERENKEREQSTERPDSPGKERVERQMLRVDWTNSAAGHHPPTLKRVVSWGSKAICFKLAIVKTQELSKLKNFYELKTFPRSDTKSEDTS